MSEKTFLITEIIIKGVVAYVISVGCVALAWNVILTYLFDFIPSLSFGKLCLLTIAISLLKPINIRDKKQRSKINGKRH